MKIPIRYSHVLFAVIMSLLMSITMSGLITLINTGWQHGYLMRWLNAFVIAWPIALACVTSFAKPTKHIVSLLTKQQTP